MPAGAGSQRDYTPLGNADGSVGSFIAAPNSPTVLRDLFVRVISAPGAGTRWDIILQGDSTSDQLTCSITGAFGTSCNSGAGAASVAPGGSFRLIVQNVGGATPSNLYYGYRAVTP